MLAFEPRKGAWAVRLTRYARFSNREVGSDLKLSPTAHESYPVEMLNRNGGNTRAALLVEPSTADRISYDRYIVSGDADFTIGRSDDCALRFNRSFVSSSHARLSYSRGSWSVQDLNSSNGTYVNDARVVPGVIERLKPGDVVFVMGLRIVIGGEFFAVNNPDHSLLVKSPRLTQLVAVEVEPLAEHDAWDLATTDDEAGAFFRSPRFKHEIQKREFLVDAPTEPCGSARQSMTIFLNFAWVWVLVP